MKHKSNSGKNKTKIEGKRGESDRKKEGRGAANSPIAAVVQTHNQPSLAKLPILNSASNVTVHDVVPASFSLHKAFSERVNVSLQV